MEHPSIYEGTAQKIVEQLRCDNSLGRLRAVVMPDTYPVQNGDAPVHSDTLADFFAEIDQIEFTPGKPLSDLHEKEAGRLIVEKFIKQGHTR